MKHFYFSVTTLKRNKTYGYNTNEIRIYRIRKEDKVPVLISTVTYSTGSNPGTRVLTYQELINKGYIPKKYNNIDYYEQKEYIMHELI